MTTLLAAARIAAASSAVALRRCVPLFGAGCGGLHLAERAEHDVGERAIHGLAHDHREDEAGRAVERAGDDQHLAIEHEAEQRGREAGVGVQERDDRRHVRAADGRDQQDSE